MLVNDLSADRHFLIGGNLNGLQGYIRDAWKEKASHLSLWADPRHPDADTALETLKQQAEHMRLPFTPELIQAHLRVMLSALPQIPNVDALMTDWDRPDDLEARLKPFDLGEVGTALLTTHRRELRVLEDYQRFAEQIRLVRREQTAALDQRFRDLVQQWFQSKFVVVEDYYASGEQILDRIAKETPPGFLNRIMGLQNIKGTGLDFVYRWQAWQACHDATRPLEVDHLPLTSQCVAPLAGFLDFGLLCNEHVRSVVARIKNSTLPHPPQVLEELDRVLERLESAMDTIQQKTQSSGTKRGSWFSTAVLQVEEFLDPGDAVRRRRKADRIYEDLVNERISRDRAVAELQILAHRQKGGWLLKALSSKPAREHPLSARGLAQLRNRIRAALCGDDSVAALNSAVAPSREGIESG
jgi:hypothetical protein